MKKMSLGIFTTPLIFMLNVFFYYSPKESMKSYEYFQIGRWFSECILETNPHLLSGKWGKKSGWGKLHSKDTDKKEYTSHLLRKRTCESLIFTLFNRHVNKVLCADFLLVVCKVHILTETWSYSTLVFLELQSAMYAQNQQLATQF